MYQVIVKLVALSGGIGRARCMWGLRVDKVGVTRGKEGVGVIR